MGMQSERQEAGEGKKAFHGYPMLQTPCQALFTRERQICRDCVKGDADIPVCTSFQAALQTGRSASHSAMRLLIIDDDTELCQLVADYLKLGLSISFAGAVTYPNARRQQAAARAVPLERLLVETDAPDQTPWSRRPGPNEPAFLGEVLDALAIIRAEPRADIERATEDNARRLFGLTS